MRSIKAASFVTIMLVLLLTSGCGTDSGARKQGREAGTSRTKVDAPVDREFQRALTLMKAGQYAAAEPVLQNLSKTQPRLSGPYANLGIVYYNLERFDEAATAFNQVVELNPNDPVAYNYLGLIHRNKGEFDKARASYEKALTTDPTYAPAHLNLGILYDLYLNQLDQALVHYRQYQQMIGGDDKKVAVWIADVEKRSGQSAKLGKENTE